MNSEFPVSHPFDTNEFRKEGHLLVDTLSDYLKDALDGKEMPVLPWKNPEELTEMFSFDSAGGDKEPLDSYFKRIIQNSIHIHHPHYIGHQVTSPLPVTVLAQFCASLLNNASAIYEMGPVSMAMEHNVIKYFGNLIGYKPGFDGIFTHGGTAGNLTAMLAARQSKTDYNIWEEGVKNESRPAFMLSDQSHYSVGRNVKIMGLGEESVIRVPYDSSFRIKTSLLEENRKKAEDKGLRVISVVASACSTATGSYDDLESIADFCEKYDLWMHVDGAHGLGVLFSQKYKNLAKGIERADSIVIDFHKMFLVPALNTMVMFRNGEESYETFAQKASYLFRKSQENVWYNSAVRTIECTKSALGIIAFTALKYYGRTYFEEYIDSRYDLARKLAAIITDNPELSLATQPEANIICFRYVAKAYDNDTLNRINLAIRDKIIKEGSFYVVQAEVEGLLYIRLTIINPVTAISDFESLIQRIIIYGRNGLC